MIENIKNHKHYFYVVLLLLLARAATLSVFSFVDTTEGRYAGIAKNILDYNNWVTPQLWHNGELIPFLGKPPLFFWSSAVCMKLMGQNEFAARLPGLLSFITILYLIFTTLKKYASSEIAWRAVFLCLSSVVLYVASGLVIVDIMLSLGVTGAYLAFFAFTAESNRSKQLWLSRAVFLFLAIGFMVKGPIAIVLFGLPVFIWCLCYRNFSYIRLQAWPSGLALFFAIITPWLVLAEIKNPGFLKYFFINENFLRFVIHEYGDKYGSGHEHIRGTAIIMMLIAACPWSFYALFRIIHYRKSFALQKIISCKQMNFFLIIVLVDTLFWSIARQLLMTYLFPLVPAFLIWLSMLIQKQDESKKLKCHAFNYHAIVLCTATVIGLLVAGPVISQQKSTKDIIKVCNAISSADKIYFVKDVPYSAYFYAKDKIIPHHSESMLTSLGNCENAVGVLCVINTKNYKKLPGNIRKSECCVINSGSYSLLEPY